MKNNLNSIDTSSNYGLQDDDPTLLQMSLLKKLTSIKEPIVDKCKAYHYQSCGHRGPDCPECYNCTCVPIKGTSTSSNSIDMDEMVSIALDPNFVIPDKYDPIMRQEVSSEPLQYTDQSLNDYQRLTDMLKQRSSMDPAYAGGFLSPPPAQQMQDIIKLLIDLMDNKQDVKAYKASKTFENPHDWMYIVNTDKLAYKIGMNQFMDALPLNQLEQQQKKIKFIDDRPRNEIKMPARTPSKPIYSQIDNVAELYNNFKETSPVSVQQLLVPVNRVLSLQATQQSRHEQMLEDFRKSLKIKRDTKETDHKGHNSIEEHVKSRSGTNRTDGELLKSLYRKYVKIVNSIENQEAQEDQKQNSKKNVENEEIAEEKETKNKEVPPNYVVFKGDSRVLLGDGVGSSQLESDLEMSNHEEEDDYVIT